MGERWLPAYRYGGGYIGDIGREGIAVGAVAVVCEAAVSPVLGRGLGLRLGAGPDARLFNPVDVALPLARLAVCARYQFGKRKTDTARREIPDRTSISVTQLEIDDGRAGNRDIGNLGGEFGGIADVHTDSRSRFTRRSRRTVVTVVTVTATAKNQCDEDYPG